MSANLLALGAVALWGSLAALGVALSHVPPFLLTGLSELMQELLDMLGLDAPGAKQVFYGVCLLVVVMALPDGIWPWLARRLGVTEPKR